MSIASTPVRAAAVVNLNNVMVAHQSRQMEDRCLSPKLALKSEPINEPVKETRKCPTENQIF
jgi:hypothetical protein